MLTRKAGTQRGLLSLVVALFTSITFLSACSHDSNPPPTSTPPPSATPLTVTYATPPAYTVGVNITPLTPTTSGGPVTFSVSPALPDGLSLDSSTGAISGAPAALANDSGYVITAKNASQSATSTVTFTIVPKEQTEKASQGTLALASPDPKTSWRRAPPFASPFPAQRFPQRPGIHAFSITARPFPPRTSKSPEMTFSFRVRYRMASIPSPSCRQTQTAMH